MTAPSKPIFHLDGATSSLALARDLEAAHEGCLLRFTESVARCRPQAGAAWKALAGGHMLYSGPSPFTVAAGMALQRPISTAEFHRIEEFFRRRGVPSAIEVCPYSDVSLLKLLQARGYRVGEVSSVLCRDLRKDAELPGSCPPGVCVRWAEAHEAELWADLMIRLIYASDPGTDARANLVALFRAPDSLSALAVLDGRVVGIAGGMLPLAGGVAALFYSGTLPQFRRRGIHAALLHFRLGRARQHGCPLAVVTAIPGSDSERNLQRHGFMPIYQKHTYVRTFSSAEYSA